MCLLRAQLSDVVPPQLSVRQPFGAELMVPDPLEPDNLVKAVETRVRVAGVAEEWVDPGADATDDVDAPSDITVIGPQLLVCAAVFVWLGPRLYWLSSP